MQYCTTPLRISRSRNTFSSICTASTEVSCCAISIWPRLTLQSPIRSIAPRLYLAIGIRGAVYHMTGVRRAGLIVAVNKDPKAPIFKDADYGIVGDLAEVLPLLTRRLEAAKGGRR